MCRLFITNRQDFNNYDKRYGILNLMNTLEKSCGGHGNGYLLVKGGKIEKAEKGIRLENPKIYKQVKREAWDYMIYHSRIASVGNQSDANCHPFYDNTHNSALAMNGTESGLKGLANGLGITDTELIFRSIQSENAEKACKVLLELGSVFVGFGRNGVPYVVKDYGDLDLWRFGDKSFHASEFPKNVKNTMKCPYDYVWIDGQTNEIITKNKKKSVYYYNGGKYYDSFYDHNTTSFSTKYGTVAIDTDDDIETPEDELWQAYEDGWNEGYSAGRESIEKELLEDGGI